MMILDSGLLFGPPCIQVTIEVCAHYTLFTAVSASRQITSLSQQPADVMTHR